METTGVHYLAALPAQGVSPPADREREAPVPSREHRARAARTRRGLRHGASPAAVSILTAATRSSQRGLEMGDLFFLVNKVYFCSE